jgi:hypothetical protein
MTMFATIHKPPPHHYHLGGLCISNSTAVQWASCLKGRELHPVMVSPTVKKVIFAKLETSCVYFRQVGEVSGVHWMLITHSTQFNRYKDMDTYKIPQFELGEKDTIAQKLLEEVGTLNLIT